MSTTPDLIRALVYLQATTIFNSIRQRIRRLRQPKYLFGALAGAAYLYFFVFHRMFQGGADGHGPGITGLPPEMTQLMAAIGGLVLLVIVVLAWLLPSDRAALRFSEAEVAFLFPAPLSRVSLIQFSLLRSQLAIFFSAFLMSLLLRRGGSMGSSALQQAFGIWLMLAILKLHFLGASFVRERLLDLGVRPLLRRVVVGGLVLLVAAGCWWWIRGHIPLPRQADIEDGHALANYVGSILDAPPVSWVLAPFKATVTPLFAIGGDAFLRALLPALGLLFAHYLWVVRSNVSFEEASIDRARQRAERRTATGAGKQPFQRGPAKPRSAPFQLAPVGFPPVAFLWKGLIGAGPMWRLRTWLIACAIIVLGGRWLAADPALRPLLKILGGLAAMACVWLFLAGPMFVQRGLRQTLDHLDVLKASPLRGWQIVLGELLTPIAIITFAQWLLLVAGLVSLSGRTDSGGMLAAANVYSSAVGIALIAPPLCGLMLCVPFAGLLYFPAWADSPGGRGGGIEVMGQRMIFFGAYLVTLALALIPAVLVGGLVFLLVNWLGNLPSALLSGALVAGLVLAAEMATTVWWLGMRVDRFDVSQELR